MLGDLFSAGVSLFNGIFNREAQSDWNNQQMQMARQNEQTQREFAQHGIRWKVADAQAAGLHPLAALGSQTTSFSPVSVGGDAAKLDLGSMGQDIGRAIKAATTQEERAERVGRQVGELAVERGSLENEILRAELNSRLRREEAGTGPAFPGGRVPTPRSGPLRMPSGEAIREEDLKSPIEDQPSPSSGRPYGFQLPYNPHFGSAQAFEDRYGDSEIAQTIKFLANTGADFWQWASHDPYAGKRGPSSAARRRAARPWGE